MIKSIVLFLLFSLGVIYPSFSQEEIKENTKQHIIHLHNGSALIGILMQYEQGKPVIIELGDGEQIAVSYTSVQSLELINRKIKKSILKRSKKAPYEFKEKGWHYGGNLGLIDNNSSLGGSIGLSVDVDATYQFSRLLGLGMAIGHDSYGENGQQDYLTIQVVVTGYIAPKYTTLFYSIAGGHSIGISDQENTEWLQIEKKGGFMFYPKIGIRLSGKDGINTKLFSGIKIQKSTLERRWGEEFEELIKQERTFHRFIIGVGLVF